MKEFEAPQSSGSIYILNESQIMYGLNQEKCYNLVEVQATYISVGVFQASYLKSFQRIMLIDQRRIFSVYTQEHFR